MVYRVRSRVVRPSRRRWVPGLQGAASETPGVGGSVASGFELAARAAVDVGSAAGQGSAPVAVAAVTVGGAAGQGTSIVGVVSATAPGGSVAAGQAATAAVVVATGGAQASGLDSEPAVVSVASGGATAGGFSPTDSSGVSETPGIGAAVGSGNDVSARTALAIGVGDATGTALTIRVTQTAGSAAGNGVAPVTAVVFVTVGGATGSGNSPNDPSTVFTGRFDLPTPGGNTGNGSPAATIFDYHPGVPAQPGTPGANQFDRPRPRRVTV